MKKPISILLALVLILTGALIGCQKNGTTQPENETGGLESADNEYGIQEVPVTDKNGETVTDAQGKPVTTEVQVKYELKNGKTIAKVIDANGEVVTDKSGKEVTVKPDIELTTAGKKKKTTQKEKSTQSTKPTQSTTVPTQGDERTTEKDITDLPVDKDKVPTIKDARKSKTKKAVTFSSQDQQLVKSMLEVPYLYKASYENADGIPINIAAHVAIWQAERKGMSTDAYAEGDIILDLFRYFGQTVINFKTRVNSEADTDNIHYNANNKSFTITDFESKKQDVAIQSIEFLGNNNYYLVTGKVSGAGTVNKVYAIIQKNKLDATLGFSVKALKWS